MYDDEIKDAETIEEQKEIIEDAQELTANEIVEPDEAAGAAEGLDNSEDHPLSIDVPEDRDATPPQAIELE